MCVTFLIPVTKASCILHNICEMQNNKFLPEWEERISSLEVLEEPEACGHNEMMASDAADKCEAMATFFFLEYVKHFTYITAIPGKAAYSVNFLVLLQIKQSS